MMEEPSEEISIMHLAITVVIGLIIVGAVLVPIINEAGDNGGGGSGGNTTAGIYTNTGDYYYTSSDDGDVLISIYSTINNEGTENETISIFVDVNGYEVSFTDIPLYVANVAGQMERLNENVISLPLAWGHCYMSGEGMSDSWDEIIILKGSYGRDGGSAPSQYGSDYIWSVEGVDIEEINGEIEVIAYSFGCNGGEGTEADPYIYEYVWTEMESEPDFPYQISDKYTKLMLAETGDWVYSENPVYTDTYYQIAVGNHYAYDYNSSNYYEYIEYGAYTLMDETFDESLFDAYLYRTYGYYGRIEGENATLHQAISSYGSANINKDTSAIYSYTYSNKTTWGLLDIEDTHAIVPVSVEYDPMLSGTNPDPFVPMSYSSTPSTFRITVDAEFDGEFLTTLTLDSNGSITVPVGEIADGLRDADWSNLSERQMYLLGSVIYPIYLDDEYAVWYHLGGSAYVIDNYDGNNLNVLMDGVKITEVSCDGTNLTVKAEGQSDLVLPVSGACYYADAKGIYGAYAPIQIYDNNGLYSPPTETPHQMFQTSEGSFQYIYDSSARIGMYDTSWRAFNTIQEVRNGKLMEVGWDYILKISVQGGDSEYRVEQTPANAFILPIQVDNGSGGEGGGSGSGGGMLGTLLSIVPMFIVLGILIYVVQYFRENRGF